MSATHLCDWASERAEDLGIDIELNPNDGKSEVFIEWIRNVDGEKGAGGTMLNEMIAKADEYGVDLALRVQNGAEGLSEFYGRFGFIFDEDPRAAAEPRMIRKTENPPVEIPEEEYAENLLTSGTFQM